MSSLPPPDEHELSDLFRLLAMSFRIPAFSILTLPLPGSCMLRAKLSELIVFLGSMRSYAAWLLTAVQMWFTFIWL